MEGSINNEDHVCRRVVSIRIEPILGEMRYPHSLAHFFAESSIILDGVFDLLHELL